MKVARQKLVDMFIALGFEGAGSWHDERLYAKLSRLTKTTTPESDAGKSTNLFLRVREAVDNGEKINFDTTAGQTQEDEEPMPTTKSKKSNRRARPAKPDPKLTPEVEEEEEEAPVKKKKTKPASTKTGSVKRDKFGCREGTQAARINAAIGKATFTANQLIEKAESSPSATRCHIRSLITKGFVVKTDKGYKATGETV